MWTDDRKIVRSVYGSIFLGCDPEFFFARDGQVIGAERVIPATGLLPMIKNWEGKDIPAAGKPGLVLDGVQVELNPAPSYCRAGLASNISGAMRALRAHLQTQPGVKASFAPVVEVGAEEFEGLGEKAKSFGCAPSFNAHEGGAVSKITVDPAVYRTRTAGGHIHFGLGAMRAQLDPRKLANVLDVLLGNTCVLLDRDPGQVERRKVYGKAGEYRTPAHGFEYRTLSNFWLRSYPLYAFVMALARTAIGVVATTYVDAHEDPHDPSKRAYLRSIYGAAWPDNQRQMLAAALHVARWDAESALMHLVDLSRVAAAINLNDARLARENFDAIKPFIRRHIQEQDLNSLYNGWGLAPNLIDDFELFAARGIDHWFPEDPLAHWCALRSHTSGWEMFVKTVLRATPLAT